jgi:integrase
MPRRGQGPRLKWLDKRNCYYIVFTEHGRSRERSTGTADRERAEEFFAEFLAVRRRADGRVRDPSEILVTDTLADYAREVGPAVMNPERIAYAMVPLAEFWEGRAVAAISAETLRGYARWRNRSAGTIRREIGVLRAALNHGFGEGRITRQIPVKMPVRRPEAKARWLTRQEAAALLNAARKSYRARLHLPLFILMGLYTGKRKEALLSLRWPQVDFAAGRIDWNPPGRPLTKKQRGLTRIPRRLRPHLRRAYERRRSDTGCVIEYEGHPVKDVKRAFAAACEAAGVEGASPHTLRHTCATWLMQHGVDKWEAAGFLGMTLQTLESTYGHHHPDYQEGAANAL